jgi:hypothetical protein
MRHTTSQSLYDYWNGLRRGRAAPERYEIQPKHIAPLLPETFIVECGETDGYRIRLAGTRICEQFGVELRDADLVELWSDPGDRIALLGLIRNIKANVVAGYGRFELACPEGRRAQFELALLPLFHNGDHVNRLLGAISVIDPPWWLGEVAASRLRMLWLSSVKPAPMASFPPRSPENAASAEVLDFPRRSMFRVLEGGRKEPAL